MARMPSPVTFQGPRAMRAELLAALGDAGLRRRPGRRVDLTVLDSYDGLLYDAGLRLTLGCSRHLSLTGRGLVTARIAVERIPRWPSDLPSGPVRRRVAGPLGVRALLPVATVTARASTFERLDDDGKAVVRGQLLEGLDVTAGPAAAVTEPPAGSPTPAGWILELEPMVGYERERDGVVDALGRLGVRAEPVPWFELAIASAGVDLRGHRHEPTIALDPAAPIVASTRAVLTHLMTAVDANWQPTIDHVDPEFLHDLRVALRRTRSVLRDTRTVLPDAVGAAARSEFGRIAAATSDARDLDVYLLEWSSYTRALTPGAVEALTPARALLVDNREAAHDHLGGVLGDAATQAWTRRWRDWLSAPVTDADQGADQHEATARFVTRRIERAHRRVVRDGRRITDDTPAEELHELRKDAKRLRYLIECLGGVFADDTRGAFVKRLKVLQENLGEHQDAEVHVAHLHELSRVLHARRSSAATLVALGQLAEQLDRRRQRARREFGHHFADFDSKATRRDLSAMLAAVR